MRKEDYLKKVDEYNASPNYCLECGKPIICTEDVCLANVVIKKFCSRSCSASYNNRITPKNKKGNPANLTYEGSINYIEKFTDDEIIEFYNTSKSKKEFSKKLGYKNFIDMKARAVRQRLDDLNLDYDLLNTKSVKSKKHNVRTCSKCGKSICDENSSGLCQQCYRETFNENKISHWLETGDTGCKPEIALNNAIRKYILEHQDNKCAICGMDRQWNGKELKFILDHIDGNAANNMADNLRLICPNCDSQLDTYKSKNKNSARNFRKKYYEQYKNVS